MKAERYFSTKTVLRAAENVKNKKSEDLYIRNPGVINSISEQQIREAFIRASQRLDAMKRQES